MSDRIALEDVERLAVQLPPTDQLKLVAHVCEQLSSNATVGGNEEALKERLEEVDAWLVECDAVAGSIEGEFDSAEDLRQIREERVGCL